MHHPRQLPRKLPRQPAVDLALVLCRIRRLAGVRNAEIAVTIGAEDKKLDAIDAGRVPDQETAYSLLQLLHHVGGDTCGLGRR